MSDFQDRIEAVRRKKAENIRKYGFTIDMVVPGDVVGQHDYHTHGLRESLGFELQVVLPIDPKVVSSILNDVVPRLRKGEITLEPGTQVTGVIDDNLPVAVMEVIIGGLPLRRIIFPDANGNLDRATMDPDYAVQYVLPKLENN